MGGIDKLVDEFIARYATDQPLHAEDLVDAHPEIAEELAGRLAAAERLLAREPPECLISVPGYELRRQLSRGGQGVVYEAVQHSTHRRVVVKLLLGGALAPADTRRRFEHEIHIAAQFSHPNIVPIYDSGATADGTPFYVMAHVKGLPLNRYVREHELTTVPLLTLFAHVCDALEYAHRHGVIHRDLKPSNILVEEEGTPKVLDFGLAKESVTATADSLTLTGAVLGTLPYMAPEQARGEARAIDTRTDVYTLGVILYELLTGTFPYPVSGSLSDVARHIAETPPASLRRAWAPPAGAGTGAAPRSGRRSTCPIDAELETIVLKALAKQRERRYQTVAALHEDLRRYLAGEPIEAKRDSRAYLIRKTLTRYRTVVVATLVCLALAIGAAVAMTLLYAQATRQRVLADERAESLRRSLYLNNIALAQSALEAENVAHLKELLADCPPELRGWEWQHLNWRADASTLTLRGHQGSVLCVAISPDGRQIASGGIDGTLRVWDASGGTLLHTLTGHGHYVDAVAFSPDARYLASASRDRTIRIWDLPGGGCVAVLRGHEREVLAVAFSPDSARLVSGGADRSVRVWSCPEGDEMMTLREAADEVVSVAFSPDGSWLAAGDAAGYVRVSDATSGAQRVLLPAHEDRAHVVAFTSDGRRLISGGWDRTVKVWDLSTGALEWASPRQSDRVDALAVSPDARTIAVGTAQVIRLWDRVTGVAGPTLRGHDMGVTALAFSRDGAALASSALDKTVRLWDPAAAGRDPLTLLGHEGYVDCGAFSPSGRLLATGSEDGAIIIWDVQLGIARRRLPGHSDRANAVAFSHDGQQLVSAGWDGTVRLWRVTDGAEVRTINSPAPRVHTAIFAPDAAGIVSAGVDGVIRMYDAHSGTLLHSLLGHSGAVASLTASGDGRLLASGGSDQTVRVWEAASGTPVSTLLGAEAEVISVAFSADATRVVAACADATLRVWDSKSGRLTHTLHGHNSIVKSGMFSPDGRRILSGAMDGTVRLWDAESGRLLLTLRGHDGPVGWAAMSPDGRRLASGGVDHTVKLWDCGPPE